MNRICGGHIERRCTPLACWNDRILQRGTGTARPASASDRGLWRQDLLRHGARVWRNLMVDASPACWPQAFSLLLYSKSGQPDCRLRGSRCSFRSACGPAPQFRFTNFPRAVGRPPNLCVPGIPRMLSPGWHCFRMSEPRIGWQAGVAAEPAVLSDRNISALAADRSGRLWVGYFDRGLDLMEPDFGRTTHVENEHVFCVNRIWPDAKTGNRSAVGLRKPIGSFRRFRKPRTDIDAE